MTLVHTKTRFEKSHLGSAAACCGGACSTELRSCVAGGVHTHGSLAAWPVAACERGSSTSFARKRAGEAQKHCVEAAFDKKTGGGLCPTEEASHSKGRFT